jgi:hypothetical protein
MKTVLIGLWCLGTAGLLYGQACWTYTYDAMGNRTARVRSADVFKINIIDVGQSQNKNLGGSGRPMTDWSWVYPAYTAPGNTPLSGTQSGPVLETTAAANRRMFNEYQAPRFWTVDIRVCDPAVQPIVRSIQYEMYRIDNNGAVLQSFNTIENNPPYLMFGNGSQYTLLYTINDPAFGFYSPTGAYDNGFPKGKYNWRIRAYDKPGVDYGPYPSNVTKNVDPTATILLEGNYFLEIINNNGLRQEAVENTTETAFAMITPNPVTRTVTLVLNNVQGEEVSVRLVDAAGRSVLSRTLIPPTNLHREEIDMSGQSTGLYFVQVASLKHHAALKVLKVSQDE